MSVDQSIGAPRSISAVSSCRDRTRVRVYFLPYAGGGAHAFTRVLDSLSADIDAQPLDYPGHGRRMREPLLRSIPEIAAHLTDELIGIDGPAIPYVLYGHSMGTLVAYEMCRLIAERHATLPILLVAAAHRAPHLPSRTAPLHALPDSRFLAEVFRLDPQAREALDVPELRALMLPILRSDFRACETYAPGEYRRLPVSLAVYGGLSDEEITRDESLAWQEHFEAACSQRFFPGGHFFLRTHVRELAWALSSDIAEAQRTRAIPAYRGSSGRDLGHHHVREIA